MHLTASKGFAALRDERHDMHVGSGAQIIATDIWGAGTEMETKAVITPRVLIPYLIK
jgi:hypothetical protein